MAEVSEKPRDPAPAGTSPSAGESIRVRGLVQGVGFRPTVWRLARDCGLAGEVCNDGAGVLIKAWGSPAARGEFGQRLRADAPPLARIDSVEIQPLTGKPPAGDFSIAPSAGGAVHTAIVADAATCAACLDEVFERADRRHRYAFTNCTHCGPRLSIVRRIPYDRANTSMAAFAQCGRCAAEYGNPADRRFHAQPNACPDCGPRVWLEPASGAAIDVDGDPIEAARRVLATGHIVAIKGIGGIHLACDAANGSAVARLRQRKHRPHKAFALMARDIAMIGAYCTVDAADAAVLTSAAAPIVVLDANGRGRLAPGVAPKLHSYGFMLAYSPLHHLLMAGLDNPIVLTSGNDSGAPQCIDNDQARRCLGGRDDPGARIADALLLHDRAIVNRVDDSVVRRIAGAPAVIRRARGYAPTPLRLPAGFAAAPPVLAFGGELKNTFCLLRDGEAIVSAHLGDLEDAGVNAAYRDTLALYRGVFEHRPAVLAVDAHPGYLSSKLGREQADADGAALATIQHHHAHIAACLADNRVPVDAPPVLGVVLDGTGYGDDATVWGGEFLLADYRGYRRIAAFAPVAMPGGEQAVRQPWRMAYAHLRRVFDWDQLQARYAQTPFFAFMADKPLATLNGMIAAGFNSPPTSSCGRLFDAVAAVCGLCTRTGYEGQAAIELEAAVAPGASHGYRFAIDAHADLPRLEPAPMWRALVRDLAAGQPVATIAGRFHAGLAAAIVAMIEYLCAGHEVGDRPCIALSGGVFQNAVLSAAVTAKLEAAGFSVLWHARVPANDGGISLGQAVIAAAQRIPSPQTRKKLCA